MVPLANRCSNIQALEYPTLKDKQSRLGILIEALFQSGSNTTAIPRSEQLSTVNFGHAGP
jgi:hypothetical protein